jgi:uncharacterized protein (DUF362 family)
MVNVSLVKSGESYDAVTRALELIKKDVKVPSNKAVLVKPNMVVPDVELCATPVQAVRATLDFLQQLGVKKFIIGEATAREDGDTMGAFRRYGYFPLRDDYDIEFRNLNHDDLVSFEALDQSLKPVRIRLAKTYFNSYVVSVARMKTHIQVLSTLSIKNIAIGSIFNPDRHSLSWHKPEPGTFSHNPKPINLSIAKLIQAISPELAVIDGVVGMEGDGPIDGTAISSGVALASTDTLALDMVATEVMGFDWRAIGYLWYLKQMRALSHENIQVLGEDIMTCLTRYKAPKTMPSILGWFVEDWRTYMGGDYRPI